MKWLLQDVRRRARFAIKNPRYALSAMIGELILADEKFLARITASSPPQIRSYLNEPISTPAFADHLHGTQKNWVRFPLRARISLRKKS